MPGDSASGMSSRVIGLSSVAPAAGVAFAGGNTANQKSPWVFTPGELMSLKGFLA